MACTVAFSYTFGGPAGAKFMQIDATNSPLFCETEFYIDTTSVLAPNNVTPVFHPADGSHGPAPLVSYFSSWRISVPVTDTEAGSNPNLVILLGSGPNGGGSTGQNTPPIVLTTPKATPQTVVVTQNVAKGITLAASGGGACGANTFSIVTDPSHGTLSGTAPDVTYTPTTNYTGDDSFTFKVVGCGVTTQADVTITVWDGCP